MRRVLLPKNIYDEDEFEEKDEFELIAERIWNDLDYDDDDDE